MEGGEGASEPDPWCNLAYRGLISNVPEVPRTSGGGHLARNAKRLPTFAMATGRRLPAAEQGIAGIATLPAHGSTRVRAGMSDGSRHRRKHATFRALMVP